MTRKKTIIIYILIYLFGVITGFAISYEFAKDLVRVHENRLWGTTAPSHTKNDPSLIKNLLDNLFIYQ